MNEKKKEVSSKKRPLVISDQQDSGTYIGLIIGTIILVTGAVVLFGDIYSGLKTEGLDITFAFIFRMGLIVAFAYGAISCFSALYRIISLNRMLSKQIGDEFEDFVIYTRPFIEEVIRQRLAVEKVIDKLEVLEKKTNQNSSNREQSQNTTNIYPKESQNVASSKWWEFLFFIALLTSISTGLFMYLEQHPYEMVPYSLIILGIAWWILMAKYFNLLFDQRSIYVPALFITFLPTASILLRIVIEIYQALFVVYLILFFYIIILYYYYKYLATGISPFSIEKLKEGIKDSKNIKAEMSAANEIETEKVSVMGHLEQILTSIQEDKIEKEAYRSVEYIPEETISHEISSEDVINVIRHSFRTKMQSFQTRTQNFFMNCQNLMWPHALSQNGKTISILGFIMVLLGTVTIIVFSETYENIFLEAIFLGVVFIAAGYPLIRKEGKRIFTLSSLPYLIGITMSLYSVIIFFHLSTIASIEENIQTIALTYIIGILFLVIDFLIGKISKHLATNE
ncbi:MAG: hypothetical protein K0A90_08185 [Methanosarcinaceae archaeon]|nr:hypothetical protein [Methanosarcinaceae archaeon]